MTGDFEASTKLDIAYINLGWWQPEQLRVGLFKMPFSLEEVTSDNYTDFQEHSFANALVPAKERGASRTCPLIAQVHRKNCRSEA